MKIQRRCLICRNQTLKTVLDLGAQPLSNRYLERAGGREYTHPLVFGICRRCAVFQLQTPVPVNELRPRVDWIHYREAEGHLDRLADTIAKLPGRKKDRPIWGVTYKDDSLLERLKRRGFGHVYRLDPTTDLGIAERSAGLETIQSRITPGVLSSVARKTGAPQIIIARHILEHTNRPREFVKGLTSVLDPHGHLIFEVPDCERAVRHGDYTMIWEEHTLYFTPRTLKRFFAIAGLSLKNFFCFPYPMENSLVSIATRAPGRLPSPGVSREWKRFERYGKLFRSRKENARRHLRRLKIKFGKIAMLGAGHLNCHFMNLLDLNGLVDEVVDDDPHKQGLLMPGSHKKIKPPAILNEPGIKLCLLGVSAEAEHEVLRRNGEFLNSKGRFLSVFPGARNSPVTYYGDFKS